MIRWRRTGSWEGSRAVKMANKNTGGGADFFQRKRGKQDNRYINVASDGGTTGGPMLFFVSFFFR